MTSTDTQPQMGLATKRLRILALTSHIALLLWMAAWHYVLAPHADYSWYFVALIYLLPLLLPLHGIVLGKPYTHAWNSFVVLFYLLHSLTVLYAEPSERWYASVELILVCALFIGSSGYARLRGRELGLGLKKLKTVMAEERARFEGE